MGHAPFISYAQRHRIVSTAYASYAANHAGGIIVRVRECIVSTHSMPESPCSTSKSRRVLVTISAF